MKRALVFGATGQLGHELCKRLESKYRLFTPDRSIVDFLQRDSIRNYVEQVKPALVINAAAMTDVDACESHKNIAHQINYLAVEVIAAACKAINARLIHVSTDYVFNGNAAEPYETDSKIEPLSEYGKTKYKAETAVLSVPNTLVVRTSWLYGAEGHNFLQTMLRLMKNNQQLSIVSDQYGAPTSVDSLAEFIELVSNSSKEGVYHWSDLGEVSWYQFAQEIYRQARAEGLLCEDVDLKPISRQDYPFVAKRPAYSVLSLKKSIADFNVQPNPWRKSLKQVMAKMILMEAQ